MQKRLQLALTATLLLLLQGPLRAQTDTTQAPVEDMNFDDFGDADDRKVKTFATQKVLYLSPTRLISLGYEAQFGGELTSTDESANLLRPGTSAINAYRGVRLAYNTPVVSRSNFILNLGATYWNTGIRFANPERSALFASLDDGLRSVGFNATAFKPFDNRHFLIVQANVDLNGTYRSFVGLSGKALTYSGTAIYGWKRDDNLMWGLGVTRTYRGGDLLHIPVLMYNRTFNPRWGIEAIIPARAAVRRNFGTNALLSFGYELEGNVYYLNNLGPNGGYLRRSEIKPRLNYERKLTGFIWLAVQAGVAINWRYDVFSTQNPVRDERPIFSNTLRNAPYVNVSLNLVSP